MDSIQPTETLFLDADFRRQVGSACRAASESIDVLVGFAKVSAMQWLADQTEGKEIIVSVVVGWTIADLAKGSSDLDAYAFARNLGWRFGIRPNLHAKIFWADRDKLLIGSANLTSRGLHLGIQGNIEAGVRITPTNVDKTKLEKLISRSLWLDDQLFSEISGKLEDVEPGLGVELGSLKWPESIEAALAEMNEFLWVDDMFMTDPQSMDMESDESAALVAHDRSLLGGLYSDNSRDQLVVALRQTGVISWLKEFLCKQQDHWARFGTISAALHNALMDDPKPYRKDIKALQNNIFGWIEHAQMPEFELRQQRRTTSIHLVSNEEIGNSWF